jgi:hypothetical protein
MVEESDWRLAGQEKYLFGKTLFRRPWSSPPSNPAWDHDHCAFCWRKFLAASGLDECREGYTTADGYYWVCDECFQDFRERFQWRVAPGCATFLLA